jgi:hypothetical protein
MLAGQPLQVLLLIFVQVIGRVPFQLVKPYSAISELLLFMAATKTLSLDEEVAISHHEYPPLFLVVLYQSHEPPKLSVKVPLYEVQTPVPVMPLTVMEREYGIF